MGQIKAFLKEEDGVGVVENHLDFSRINQPGIDF